MFWCFTLHQTFSATLTGSEKLAYALVLDAATQLANLNLQWFVDLIATNLLWVFIFAAAVWFLFDGKRFWLAFFVTVVYIWAFVDISGMTGWIFGGMALLVSFFAASVFLKALSRDSDWLSKNYGIASGIMFLAFWLGYYFFFG